MGVPWNIETGVGFMEYTDLERQFIERTLKIVKQYDEFAKGIKASDEVYEETLLINCLVGLVVLPQQKWERKIAKLPNSITAVGLEEGVVKDWGHESCRTLEHFIRKMRNAVAHARFVAESEGRIISKWTFKDKKGFEATIECGDLRTFVKKLAGVLLDE